MSNVRNLPFYKIAGKESILQIPIRRFRELASLEVARLMFLWYSAWKLPPSHLHLFQKPNNVDGHRQHLNVRSPCLQN